jgi:hypothetical protein
LSTPAFNSSSSVPYETALAIVGLAAAGEVNQPRTAAVERAEERPMISKPTDIETNPGAVRRRADAIHRQAHNTQHVLTGAGIDLLARY